MTTFMFWCISIALASSASGHQSTFLTQSIQSLMRQMVSKHVLVPSWKDEVDAMEEKVLPIFKVLPEQNSNLRPQAVRYLAHRYLLETHGMQVNGLQPCAHCLNASAPVWESVEILRKSIPSHMKPALASWSTRAIGLRDVAAIVLALEYLVFEQGFLSKWSIQRAYKLNGLDSRQQVPAHKFTEVVYSHFAMILLDGSSWIYTSKRGQKMWHRMRKEANVGLAQHQQDRKVVTRMFPDTWENLKTLTRKAVAALKKEKESQIGFSFEDVLLVITKVAQAFGAAQNKECANIKSALYEKDKSGSGSLTARSFYHSLGGDWHFTETPEYLRSMGVIDDSQPHLGPQVMVANYIAAPNNCVITASQYSVCCIPECEGILKYFESQIQGPVASPAQILAAATTVPVPTIHSGVSLDPGSPVSEALEQVAGIHGGVVPLHGRLFSQWLHYVFPSECKYPHPSGVFGALSPAEWFNQTGLSPDIDSKTPLDFPEIARTGDIKQGKNMSQWTLVEELYAGPLENQEATEFPFGPLATGIGGGGLTFGVVFMLYTTILCHGFSCAKSQAVAPEPYLRT
eukprot:gnl/MRDRNA2_/MRDRNA2_110699_c0_seq1.p1 gnl/MRDRNA2_/MRDRNA2_110699_c0~~gnl/MRDRNA2_/MRDRNA2_110699_c0_seq1.p1  ORF type:complete len:571 (+),score=82.12 gnl/MRDRNA2_/MRDRNA2_110699_c0_seq1:94-1806(+)